MDCTGYFGNPHKANFRQQKSLSTNVFDPYTGTREPSEYHNNSELPTRKISGLPSMTNNTSKIRVNKNSLDTNQFSKLTPKGKIQAKSKVLGRGKPNYILHDQEALREEVFTLNKKLDDLKNMNNDISKKVNVLENETTEYEKLIQENECFWNLDSKGSGDTKIQVNLKKDCSKLEGDLHIKQLQLEEAERDNKNTKLTELKIEKEVLEEEIAYLQRVFKDMMSSCDEAQGRGMNDLEDKYYKQKNVQNFLEKDNKEMEINLKILDEQNKAYNEEIIRYEENIRKNEDELEEQKKMIRFRDTQIRNLKKDANVEKMGVTEMKIRNELEVKISEYRELEKKLLDVKREEGRRDKQLNESEESFIQERDEERFKLDTLLDRLSHLKELDPNQDTHPEIGFSNYNDDNRADKGLDLDQEIVIIGKEIVMRLKNHKTTPYEMQEHVFGHEALNKNQVNQETMIKNLQRYPFSLKNDKAQLLGEIMRKISNMKDNSTNIDIPVLFYAFKNIVGDYDTYTEYEEMELERAVFKKCFKGRDADLKDNFKKILNNSGKTTVTIEEIEVALNQSGCKVTKEHLDYIHLALFRIHDTLEDLDHDRLFEIFVNDGTKSRNEDDTNLFDYSIGYESPKIYESGSF